MNYKTLSIIIPVYNEENTIIDLLNKIDTVELILDREIVIINDGSTDSSEKLIKDWISHRNSSHKIVYLLKQNGGKGSAVRHGIENSTGDIVIIQDADLEYNPEEINDCIKPIVDEKYKIVYGSRELCIKKREYSYLSFFLGGLIVTNWINFLFGTGITDEPTCYKTYDGELIRTLLFKGNGFDWEPEITCKLIRLGFNIHEVAISYNPRNLEEGKKINAFDGLKALWISLIWRFASLKPEKEKLNYVERDFTKYRKPKLTKILLLLFFIALAIRLLILIPGITNPIKNFSRPDTPTYIQPAKTLAATGTYKLTPQNTKLYTYRTPGYPLYLAIFYKFTDNLRWSIFFMCILSALTCIPIFYIGYYFGGKWTAFTAGLLFALNITSIAHVPLLLSDTLFTFILSVQLWYFMKFYFTKRPLFLFISVFLASIATYIRPAELLWIAPCIFLVFIYKYFYLQKKIIISISLAALFFIPLLPWMTRNYINDSGFKMSTDTGNLLYNNGAVLLGKIKNKSPEKIRQELHNKNDILFNSNPKLKKESARCKYEENQLKELIIKYPFTYLSLCFRPWILIPDLPTFCQDLGFTASGQGTFDILNTQGFPAAVNHYFKGKYWLLFITAPLLLIVFVTYVGCLLQFIKWFITRQWFLVFTSLAFIEYFLFLPGPITMPRYHLPALPFICVMSAYFLTCIFNKHPQ